VVALSGLAASSAPAFSISRQILATFARSPLDRASKAAVGDEVVAFNDEEFARSTFRGHRRALNYGDLQVAYRVAAERLLLLPFASWLVCVARTR
jgi:hypothetical protein